jgi:hypothetical protein
MKVRARASEEYPPFEGSSSARRAYRKKLLCGDKNAFFAAAFLIQMT